MNPIATITMQDGKVMRLELLPDKAPNTVNSFIALANSGYYDGLCFHRIIADFMIQGGDPDGRGTGGPGYSIKGEFRANGFKANDLSHQPGVISMARAQNPDSAGSQFFICVADDRFLDGQYAAFGKCADKESLAAAVALSKVRTGYMDRPVEPVIMKSVKVETFGKEFPTPEKV
ncbi:MAG: peptidylprolyl isomerase [Eubacteriales bacterium]|nr:peptidylprolyl isomerase [Eubacteriales bacterium]